MLMITEMWTNSDGMVKNWILYWTLNGKSSQQENKHNDYFHEKLSITYCACIYKQKIPHEF